MTICLRTTKNSALALLIFAASACANPVGNTASGLTPIGQCEVYEGQGETTEYTVELGVAAPKSEGGEFILAIQGFHPNDTSPQRIVEVRLAEIARVKPERLSNDCVCGVKFARSNEMCAYISTYRMKVKRSWLEEGATTGLNLFFELENGLVVQGPRIPASDLSAFLARH